jgi:hypothetical protein
MSTKTDRKTLTREYKERQHPIGVFRVYNSSSGKSFVGSSVNLPAMLNRQKAQLGMKGHPNRALQNDWNELGEEAFSFEILDTITPPEEPGYDPADDLKALEALWVEKLEATGEKGYNGKRS